MLFLDNEMLTREEKQLLVPYVQDMWNEWCDKHPDGENSDGSLSIPRNLEWMYETLGLSIPTIVLELRQKYPNSLYVEFGICRDLRGQ